MSTMTLGRQLSFLVTAAISAMLFLPGQVAGQQSEEELAKELANPVADLVSFPLQLNYDEGFGPGDEGERWLLNIQPVVPIELNENWNVISRTILPVIWQDDVFPGSGD